MLFICWPGCYGGHTPLTFLNCLRVRIGIIFLTSEVREVLAMSSSALDASADTSARVLDLKVLSVNK
jgi:hypothetical protein